MKRVMKRGKDAEKRLKKNKELEAELASPKSETPKIKPKSVNGMCSEKIIAQAEAAIFKNEQLGLFDAIPIKDRNLFPTLLTRIPIFMPISKMKQKSLLDEDNALSFETPFGKGKRYGANLCVFDEDVMIALSHLARKKLIGPHNKMPIAVAEQYIPNKAGHVNVNSVLCTISDLLKELDLSDGGRERRRVFASLERLASATLILTLNKNERYLGNCELGKAIKLIDIEWKRYETEGIVYGQFSPVVTYWLESEGTYLNWETRKKLKTSLAKALHRYLSSQTSQKNKEFYRFNELDDIASSIGFHCRKRDMKNAFNKALQELIDVEFLIDGEITGTSRAEPLRLYATRK